MIHGDAGDSLMIQQDNVVNCLSYTSGTLISVARDNPILDTKGHIKQPDCKIVCIKTWWQKFMAIATSTCFEMIFLTIRYEDDFLVQRWEPKGFFRL